MTTTAVTEAPKFIERDTHEGRHWRRGIPKGFRTDVYAAGELAALKSDGVLWEVQTIDGRPTCFRSRYRADADGNLHLYAADGHRVIIHPATRALRILTR